MKLLLYISERNCGQLQIECCNVEDADRNG